jgi:hypothetical protein
MKKRAEPARRDDLEEKHDLASGASRGSGALRASAPLTDEHGAPILPFIATAMTTPPST